MARKRIRLLSNFQWGSNGRDKSTETITVKVRPAKGSGKGGSTPTRTVNVRCQKGDKSEACAVAERLAAKAIESIHDAQETDEARKDAAKKAAKRKAERASRHSKSKAPF